MFHSAAASKTWPTKTAQDEQCESLTDKPRHPPLFSFLEALCYCQLDLSQREHEGEATEPGSLAPDEALPPYPLLMPLSCGWGGLTFAA